MQEGMKNMRLSRARTCTQGYPPVIVPLKYLINPWDARHQDLLPLLCTSQCDVTILYGQSSTIAPTSSLMEIAAAG